MSIENLTEVDKCIYGQTKVFSFKLQASIIILIDFVDVLYILVVYISYDTYGQLGFAPVIIYT